MRLLCTYIIPVVPAAIAAGLQIVWLKLHQSLSAGLSAAAGFDKGQSSPAFHTCKQDQTNAEMRACIAVHGLLPRLV